MRVKLNIIKIIGINLIFKLQVIADRFSIWTKKIKHSQFIQCDHNILPVFSVWFLIREIKWVPTRLIKYSEGKTIMFILKVLAVRYIPHFIENHNESESVHNTFSIVGFYWNIIINFKLSVMTDIHSPCVWDGIFILVRLPTV